MMKINKLNFNILKQIEFPKIKVVTIQEFEEIFKFINM